MQSMVCEQRGTKYNRWCVNQEVLNAICDVCIKMYYKQNVVCVPRGTKSNLRCVYQEELKAICCVCTKRY